MFGGMYLDKEMSMINTNIVAYHTLTKLYLKRKNQLKTALFTIAHKLCDEYTHIVIGDYVPTPDLAK